jgi:hypothetical protein
MARVPKLDKIDVHILAELQRQGRIDNKDLAGAVGLTPSPWLKRVRALAFGPIQNYAKGVANFQDRRLEDDKTEVFGDPQILAQEIVHQSLVFGDIPGHELEQIIEPSAHQVRFQQFFHGRHGRLKT